MSGPIIHKGPDPRLRPRILCTAAHHAAARYVREDHCPAAFRGMAPEIIVSGLIRAEADLEQSRRERAPHYSPRRHVHILGALLAEVADPNPKPRRMRPDYRRVSNDIWSAPK